ncbi:NUDIX domain-containing protein [Pseudonocardiaceae bacterium YIM PH 21723]|nr:NUDIX domain-containing protein [Pseudonocardiaceae bacterium YIM PH 21723]
MAPIVRRSARAVLVDEAGRLVTVKRTKPGIAPYWTTPGGGVEAEDSSYVAAVERELLEELGAIAAVGRQLIEVTTLTNSGKSVQHFFVARLVSLDAALRSGAEHTDASRGGYEVDRIPLDELDDYDLKPAQIKDFIMANRSALLADLLPAVLP